MSSILFEFLSQNANLDIEKNLCIWLSWDSILHLEVK